MEGCVFCKRNVPTRGHDVVPRCKGGKETVATCHSCEDFIHKTWSHNQLRDEFNTIEKIRADDRFKRFLRWLRKQQVTSVFRTDRNRTRTARKYR
jgi:5-methylcytosine-specific restriction enzyme A